MPRYKGQVEFEEGDKVKYIGTPEDLIEMHIAHKEEAINFYNKIKDRAGTVKEVSNRWLDVDFGETARRGSYTIWSFRKNLLVPFELPETIDVPELKYKGQFAPQDWKPRSQHREFFDEWLVDSEIGKQVKEMPFIIDEVMTRLEALGYELRTEAPKEEISEEWLLKELSKLQKKEREEGLTDPEKNKFESLKEMLKRKGIKI